MDAFTTSTACCDLDLQNLLRSTVADGKYSLSVLSKLLKAFMMDEQQNERGGRTDRKVKNRMPSPTVSGGKHQRFNVSERDAYVQ